VKAAAIAASTRSIGRRSSSRENTISPELRRPDPAHADGDAARGRVGDDRDGPERPVTDAPRRRRALEVGVDAEEADRDLVGECEQVAPGPRRQGGDPDVRSGDVEPRRGGSVVADGRRLLPERRAARGRRARDPLVGDDATLAALAERAGPERDP